MSQIRDAHEPPRAAHQTTGRGSGAKAAEVGAGWGGKAEDARRISGSANDMDEPCEDMSLAEPLMRSKNEAFCNQIWQVRD